jgi:hypothetical protein
MDNSRRASAWAMPPSLPGFLASRDRQASSPRSRLVVLMRIITAPLDAVLKPGEMYDRAQLCAHLQISQKTLTKWIRAGLRPIRPGTKKQFFLGAAVIAFMQKNSELLHNL